MVEGWNEFMAGHFATPSLEELRQQLDLDQAVAFFEGRPLTVRQVVADVSELHTLQENRFAVFQAASQFNTLEHTSPYGLPQHGITCYTGDRTQGPACATACAPGTIVRNYLAFDGLGQSDTRQVQTLAEVEDVLNNKKNKFFRVVNGYTLADTPDLWRLSKVLAGSEPLRESIRKALRIGVQTDTEVVCSCFGTELYPGKRMEQLVTQAYCSAISVSYSAGDTDSWEAFARLILEALYEATLYVAVDNAQRHPREHGARKVFLTAVGGGVFGNEMNWIQEAMSKAFVKFKKVGLDVVLVSYGGPTPEFEDLAAQFPQSSQP